MPESTNPAQQPQTIIEIRPYRAGWQAGSALTVPAWDRIGWTRKLRKMRLATQRRAKFGHSEIRVLKDDGLVESVIIV